MTRGRRATRRANQKPRAAVPTALTPRAEWDESEPDPVATQPEPPADQPGTDVVPLDPELAAAVAKIPACSHCGGRHIRACPRIREMHFHPNGTIAAVKFWRGDQWSTDNVLFDDELPAD